MVKFWVCRSHECWNEKDDGNVERPCYVTLEDTTDDFFELVRGFFS